MAILVTRPEPDNQITAQALRARGYEVLMAPEPAVSGGGL